MSCECGFSAYVFTSYVLICSASHKQPFLHGRMVAVSDRGRQPATRLALVLTQPQGQPGLPSPVVCCAGFGRQRPRSRWQHALLQGMRLHPVPSLLHAPLSLLCMLGPSCRAPPAARPKPLPASPSPPAPAPQHLGRRHRQSGALPRPVHSGVQVRCPGLAAGRHERLCRGGHLGQLVRPREARALGERGAAFDRRQGFDRRSNSLACGSAPRPSCGAALRGRPRIARSGSSSWPAIISQLTAPTAAALAPAGGQGGGGARGGVQVQRAGVMCTLRCAALPLRRGPAGPMPCCAAGRAGTPAGRYHL